MRSSSPSTVVSSRRSSSTTRRIRSVEPRPQLTKRHAELVELGRRSCFEPTFELVDPRGQRRGRLDQLVGRARRRTDSLDAPSSALSLADLVDPRDRRSGSCSTSSVSGALGRTDGLDTSLERVHGVPNLVDRAVDLAKVGRRSGFEPTLELVNPRGQRRGRLDQLVCRARSAPHRQLRCVPRAPSTASRTSPIEPWSSPRSGDGAASSRPSSACTALRISSIEPRSSSSSGDAALSSRPRARRSARSAPRSSHEAARRAGSGSCVALTVRRRSSSAWTASRRCSTSAGGTAIGASASGRAGCPHCRLLPGLGCLRLGWADLLKRRPLLGERACELEPGDCSLGDENLSESLPRVALREHRRVELALAHDTVLDEDLADRATLVIVLHRGRSDSACFRRLRARGRGRCSERGVSTRSIMAHCSARTPASSTRGTPKRPTRISPSSSPVSRLRDERLFELIVGDVPALDEDLADQRRRKGCRVGHSGGVIGRPSFEL